MASLKALLEQREDLLSEAEGISKRAGSEGRDITANEDARLTKIMDKRGLIWAVDQELIPLQERENEALAMARVKAANRSPQDILRRTQGDIDSTDPDAYLTSGNVIYQPMARLKAFPNTPQGAKDAYSCGMWFRAVNSISQNAGRDTKAEAFLEAIGWHPQMAQTEGTDTKGGFLVPRPMSTAIITIRENVGVARRLCDIVPMSSNTEDIPKRTGGLTVYYPGEGNTVTTSDMVFGRVNLVAKKRAVANQISSELSDDALINMTDRAIDEMAYALADKEDGEFINGDGTSTYGGEQGLLDGIGSGGIFTAPSGESTWLLLSLTSMSQWKAKLPGRYFQKDRMAILCTSEFYYLVFERLMNAANGTTNTSLRTGGLFDVADLQFSGIPVFLSDKMPSSTAVSQNSALYENFSLSCMLGDRTGARIAVSRDYAFLDDVDTILATSRYDLNFHEPGDDTDAGGIVGLSTAAS